MMASRYSSHWDLRGLLGEFPCDTTLPAMQVDGISSDSRFVQPGEVFFAIPGITSNGIDYVNKALEAGAVAVVYDASDSYSVERVQLLQKQCHTLWLGIDDLARHAGDIASRFYGYPSREMTMIGVTGTDGKSSVTHMLVQALNRLGRRTASIGTLGSGIANELESSAMTTPMAFDVQRKLADFRQQGCQVVVMEVSSHALHQYRVAGCEFDCAIFTNLGRDHLDYHGDMASYGDSKARLFEDFPLQASVLNIDDEFGRQLMRRQRAPRSVSYSAAGNSKADIRLLESELLSDGLSLTVRASGVAWSLQNRLLGRFNIDNTLACFACLTELDFEPAQIVDALTDLQPIPGRMECFSGPASEALVVVDFAHTEQALRSCLQACRAHCSGKLWCVFGCGGDRDPGKRPLMARAAEELAEELVITDDNPRGENPADIVNDMLSGISDAGAVKVIHDRRAAIQFAIDSATAGDLVVVAGKGHEQEQIIGDQRLPFSDRQAVQDFLGATDD